MAPVPVVQQPEHAKARRTAEVSVFKGDGAGRAILQFDQSKLSEVFSKINGINETLSIAKLHARHPGPCKRQTELRLLVSYEQELDWMSHI
jgi:hypothetical protein